MVSHTMPTDMSHEHMRNHVSLSPTNFKQ
uniref:Uncharacterized protein n=1 Tax=Arundo donax TaxID=35708 RepID=A0A0A9G3Y9_ARUDO